MDSNFSPFQVQAAICYSLRGDSEQVAPFPVDFSRDKEHTLSPERFKSSQSLALVASHYQHVWCLIVSTIVNNCERGEVSMRKYHYSLGKRL